MSKQNKHRILVILIFYMFFISLNLSYAEESINFKNITIKDGLSQSTVQTIFQDSKGYIWMGTNDGLNRYNGYRIKVYKSEDENNSISDNYIVNIIEDKNKNLWISTVYGLSKINIEDGSIKNYFSQKEKGNLSNDFIYTTLVTDNNKILVGTKDGINIYNEETDSFERIISKKSQLENQEIKSMIQDKHGDIWIGTKEGLNKIEIKNNKIEKYSYKQEIHTIKEDSHGYIWASTLGGGVVRINIETNEEVFYTRENKSIESNYVRAITQDKYGDIWLATEKGLAKYKYEEDSFTTYTNKSYDQNSLVNDFVYTVIEDKSGLIWAGTYSGVSVFDPNTKIEHYKNNPFDKNSLSENMVHGIYEDDDGHVWVGTKSSGLNIIDRDNGDIKQITEGQNEFNLSSNEIKVITGKGNKVWVGTKNGVNEINKDDMTVKTYTEEDNLAGENIKSLLIDSKGYLWIGTPDGLSILNTKDNTIKDITYVLSKNNIDDTYIQDIYEDKNGIYWVGTFLGGGLIKIDPFSKTIHTYKSNDDTNEKNNVNMNSIRSISEDNHGNLWIGTSYGLNKFDKKSEVFTSYTKKNGLNNNTIYGVVLDIYGNPWMSTNNGISMIDVDNNTIVNLTITDGLQGNEFNGKAYYRSKKGELFFGGINGLNIFYPDEIVKKQYTPNIVFDGFEVDGNKYSNIDNNKFKHYENRVRIKYFVPDYKNDSQIQYEYKLEGLSEEWTSVNNNEVIFNKLDPGKYNFKIKYTNKSGYVSDESSIAFTIEPPFWKSKFAFILYAILIIIIVYIIRNRVKTLDALVRIKTKELSLEMEKNNRLLNQVIKLERNKNNYFVNLSHELRTPLNVINSIEQLVTEFNKSGKGISKDKLDYYMGIMRKNNKRLLNLINNIIDTTKIEHGSYKTNMELNDIVYIVEEAALGLKDYIESKGVDLVIDTDIEEKIILCDHDEIERSIVNLVSNAAKFTPSGGSIEVSINDLGKKVKITVTDTGLGIDEKFHKSIFDRFNQVVDSSTETKGGSGLGLTITKHIIDIHNGDIFVESKKNKGSKFTILLPVKKQ